MKNILELKFKALKPVIKLVEFIGRRFNEFGIFANEQFLPQV